MTKIQEAHSHTICNKSELKQSVLITCSSCLKTMIFEDVKDWTDTNPQMTIYNSDQPTGLCPFCSIDALIGSDSGVSPETIKEINDKYFS